MIDTLLEWDKNLLQWLNSFHHPALDPVAYLCSQTWFWIPLYIALLWIVFQDYRKDAWIIVVGIAFTILFTDQLTSTVMKPFFGRLRPSHNPELAGLLHFVTDLSGEVYLGGFYGFASGHAANTFGITTLLILLLRSTRPWIYWLFAWAGLMTYTRIYMGVHYPGDILVGAFVGVVGGMIGFRLCKWGFGRRQNAVESPH